MTTKMKMMIAFLLTFSVACGSSAPPAKSSSCADPEPTPEEVTVGMCR
jgi:hypothetical protein